MFDDPLAGDDEHEVAEPECLENGLAGIGHTRGVQNPCENRMDRVVDVAGRQRERLATVEAVVKRELGLASADRQREPLGVVGDGFDGLVGQQSVVAVDERSARCDDEEILAAEGDLRDGWLAVQLGVEYLGKTHCGLVGVVAHKTGCLFVPAAVG